MSKKTRDKGAAAVALAASLCAVLVHVEALVVSQAGRAGSYPQAGEPSVLRPSARGHLRPKGAPKSLATPVLKVFRTYASFRVALGFAQPPRQFARIPEQGVSPTKVRKVPQKCVLDSCVQDRLLVSLIDRLE